MPLQQGYGPVKKAASKRKSLKQRIAAKDKGPKIPKAKYSSEQSYRAGKRKENKDARKQLSKIAAKNTK